MTDTPHLGLPLIAASQSQKHVTHNQAIVVLDAIVMLSVVDSTHTTPPASPSEGDRYKVASGATGAWAAWDLNIALYTSGQWVKLVPKKGWLCFDEATGALTVWTGSSWTDLAAAGGYLTIAAAGNGTLAKLGILTAADDTNRLAVKSDGVLLSHDDVTPGSGDMRVALNKSAAGNDAGFVFQQGFSTRSLFGLLGDDDFTVKVSPDGSNYFTGFIVERATGQLRLPLAPKFSAYTNFDNYIAANTWTKVQFNNADSNDQNAFSDTNNNFTAPFAGNYAFGFSFRFKANATVPTKVIATFYKNGAELGRGRAVSGASVDDVTTYNLSVLTPLAANDVIDVRVHFATSDGYIEADQSHFWGHYVP
jgi:hypothetical protein